MSPVASHRSLRSYSGGPLDLILTTKFPILSSVLQLPPMWENYGGDRARLVIWSIPEWATIRHFSNTFSNFASLARQRHNLNCFSLPWQDLFETQKPQRASCGYRGWGDRPSGAWRVPGDSNHRLPWTRRLLARPHRHHGP